jgi:hypothetical protein
MASGKLAGHDTPENLFAELLGLGLKSGASRECVLDRSQVELQVEPTSEVWKQGRCPKCRHTWRVRPPWEGKAGGFSKEFGTLFAAMEKFAESVERHLDGILAHWKHGVTNAGGTQTSCSAP